MDRAYHRALPAARRGEADPARGSSGARPRLLAPSIHDGIGRMYRRLVSAVVMALTAVTALWVGCSSDETRGTGAASGSSSGGAGGASSSTTGNGGTGGGGGSMVAISCNPVTNAGCTSGSFGGAGGAYDQACDYTQDPQSGANDGFECFGPPNDATLCQMCDPTASSGPFCAGGTTCWPTDASGTTAECARFCCTDADCGSGVCVTSNGMGPFFPVTPGLGICLAASQDGGAPEGGTGDAGADDAGTGGAGAGDGGTVILACDAPAVAPSMGSCVTLGM